MKKILFAALFAVAGSVGATIPCGQGAGTCPAGSVCFSWSLVSTRETGVLVAPGEITGYQIQLNQNPPIAVTGTNYIYPIPIDGQVTPSDVWSFYAVNDEGTKSKPASCSLLVTVAGKKSPPSAPTGLTTIIGK